MDIKDFSIQELVDYSNSGGKIICFGVGLALKNFVNALQSYSVEGIINDILDNDEKSWGKQILLGNKWMEVKNPTEYLKTVKSHIVIVVTCQYLSEIKRQLDEFGNLYGSVVFYGFVLDRYCDFLLNVGSMNVRHRTGKTEKIPRIIHYCWFGRSPIPERYKEWMKSWKKYCPDYEIVEWNEDNYDVRKNEYMSQAYDAKTWGFVPDYARLDIIYKHGGIYLDTDVEIIRPLDNLLRERAFAGFQDSHSVALGLGFGAMKENAIIKAMRDDYSDVKFIDEKGNLNLRPSPSYQTECLKKIGLVPNGMYQRLNDITIFPKVYFSPMNHYNRQIRKTKETYTIHHFDGSWVGEREKSEQAKYRDVYLKMR